MHALSLMCFDSRDNTLWIEIVKTFRQECELIALQSNNVEHLRQLAVFVEWLNCAQIQTAKEGFLKAVRVSIDRLDPPNESTYLHTQMGKAILSELSQISPLYTVENEFHGLQSGVFPMDCVVYFDSKIVAFVEIDGAFHYTSDGSILRRDDQLKEYLYNKNYPGVMVLRVKNTDIAKTTIKVQGNKVAEKIAGLRKLFPVDDVSK